MLLRAEAGSVLCVGQASHAWISGQMARAWAAPFEPHEEICLAAEQHDVGMADWDLEPTLNADTGLPHAFVEMPLDTHIALWLRAPYKLLTQSHRAAALVSLHGTRLYEMRDPATPGVREFLDEQERFRRALGFERGALEPGSTLLWIWDYLSLALILGWAGEVEGISVADGAISPWPFREPSLELRCEGRRLHGRFEDVAAMRAALDAAAVEPLVLRVER